MMSEEDLIIESHVSLPLHKLLPFFLAEHDMQSHRQRNDRNIVNCQHGEVHRRATPGDGEAMERCGL